MSHDPFSDVLRLTQARSVFSGGVTAGGDWSVRFRPRGKVKLYAIAEGRCWLRAEGARRSLLLETGDVLLLGGERSFVLGGHERPGASATDRCPVMESNATMARIGHGRDCVLLSAFVELDPASASLFKSALPPLVHVPATAKGAEDLRWLIEKLDRERRSALPGAEVAAAQLAQLVLVQILRAQLVVDGALPPGWLRALREPRLGRALRLVHEAPGRAWRLEELAKAAGMSRARFAAAFKTAAGTAPLAYVTAWKMHVAQARLRDGNASVVEIGLSLGYRSESAFSHAFKRVVGMRPSTYRETNAHDFETPPQAPHRFDA